MLPKHSQGAKERSGITVLKQFSSIALPLMIGIVVTGLVVTDRMVGGNYAALFATTYGWLLNTKLTLLAVILSIAGRAHFVWLPSLERTENLAPPASHHLRKKLTVESSLGVLLVIVATLLANAVPAKHETIDHWPYPFRFSIDATWGGLAGPNGRQHRRSLADSHGNHNRSWPHQAVGGTAAHRDSGPVGHTGNRLDFLSHRRAIVP